MTSYTSKMHFFTVKFYETSEVSLACDKSLLEWIGKHKRKRKGKKKTKTKTKQNKTNKKNLY